MNSLSRVARLMPPCSCASAPLRAFASSSHSHPGNARAVGTEEAQRRFALNLYKAILRAHKPKNLSFTRLLNLNIYMVFSQDGCNVCFYPLAYIYLFSPSLSLYLSFSSRDIMLTRARPLRVLSYHKHRSLNDETTKSRSIWC